MKRVATFYYMLAILIIGQGNGLTSPPLPPVASGPTAYYNNRIPDMTPFHFYTEVCFAQGAVHVDIHSRFEPTSGGLCMPGDRGFIIEKNKRGKLEWYRAREECLQDGMRLPEPFEWQIACYYAKEWSLDSIGSFQEWASNLVRPLYFRNSKGVGTNIFGGLGCDHSSLLWAGLPSGFQSQSSFRCVR